MTSGQKTAALAEGGLDDQDHAEAQRGQRDRRTGVAEPAHPARARPLRVALSTPGAPASKRGSDGRTSHRPA